MGLEAIWLLFLFGCVVWGIARGLWRDHSKDKAAEEALKDFDIEKEKEEILAIKKDFVPEGMSCPDCGGALKSRRSKWGEFYGCSNFPKCRFTKKKPKSL